MKKLLFATFIYSVSLTAQIPSGAVGYWPFDNNAQDMSGNGNHGTVNGAIPAPDRFNQPNKAYRFNGVNSKIMVPHNNSVDIASGVDFTFTYWQKSYPGNHDNIIISKHYPGTWNGYNFVANNLLDQGYCTSAGHMYFYTASGASEDACSNGAILSDTLWHFVAGMYNATSNQSFLYIDNVMQSDIGQSSGTMSNLSNMSFGYDDDNNNGFYNGVLDGVRMYKRLLTSLELKALFQENAENLTGIKKEEVNAGFTLYPNPATGNFTLKTNAFASTTEAVIVNQLGQVVFKAKVQSEETSIETTLPQGVYYIKFVSDTKVLAVEKLVIQK